MGVCFLVRRSRASQPLLRLLVWQVTLNHRFTMRFLEILQIWDFVRERIIKNFENLTYSVIKSLRRRLVCEYLIAQPVVNNVASGPFSI